MIICALLLILFFTGFFLFLAPKVTFWAKPLCIVAISSCLLALAFVDISADLIEYKVVWIDYFNINFHVRLSALAYWLTILTLIMGFLTTILSTESSSSFYSAICWMLTAMIGIFVAEDIFLFFIFWEIALFPSYYLFLAYGNKNNPGALVRYIVYTQASGIILLISIIALAITHAHFFGTLTFNYQTLSQNHVPDSIQRWLLVGFVLSFIIKLPLFPFHSWLSPLVGSAPIPVVLIGLLVKTAVFGLLRFTWPIFPKATAVLAEPFMLWALFSILYGAILAFSQRDPKKLIAYATLSHVGLLFMGIFINQEPTQIGIVVLMISQALSTGGLFILINNLAGHQPSLDLEHMGGLWHHKPFAFFLLTFALATLGAPIFGNFVGEWLILWGVFTTSLWLAIVASLAILGAAIYSLWLFQRICFGKDPQTEQVKPLLKLSERSVLSILATILVVMGLYPYFIAASLTHHNNKQAFQPNNAVTIVANVKQ